MLPTARTPGSSAGPSTSAKEKGKARAADGEMEVGGEGEPSECLDLANNPMAEDGGDLDGDNYTNSESEEGGGGISARAGIGRR